MKNETTCQPALANIKRPMLCIAVGLAVFWGVVLAGVWWWTA